MILKFSNKLNNCKSVIFYSRELKQKTDELNECLNIIYELCRVCRIFVNRYELEVDNSNYFVHSKLKLEVHSGSMIDQETLEREIRNMISLAPFGKDSMTWILG